VDGAWRKSGLAARLLIRKEAGRLRPREQALAATCISHQKMGSTGDSPVPSGDPPLGTGERARQSVDFENKKVFPVPSGQWPDGTGGSPVLPKVGEKCGLSRDPEVTDRLIQQALYFLGVGPLKHAFDLKLVGSMKLILLLAAPLSFLTSCATDGATSSKWSPKVSGYIDTSFQKHLK